MSVDAARIARAIDHTLLKAEATPEQIDVLCDEAVAFGFAGVCVNPVYVSRAVGRLSAGGTASDRRHAPVVVAVAGFPLGACPTTIKADEARRAMDEGAAEIDMVASIGLLVAGDRQAVRGDIEAVARVVHRANPPGILKVILETGLLARDKLVLGCRCCAEAEADFVKTSTGFHPSGGATVEHVRLLYHHASPIKVKASGGIRTARAAIAMLDAGAVRLGTSAGVAIMQAIGDRGA